MNNELAHVPQFNQAVVSVGEAASDLVDACELLIKEEVPFLNAQRREDVVFEDLCATNEQNTNVIGLPSCRICDKYIKSPLFCRCSEPTVCSVCINSFDNGKCDKCDAVPIGNQWIESQLSQMTMKCPYHESLQLKMAKFENNTNKKKIISVINNSFKVQHCEWKGNIGDLSNHLKNDCKMECSICGNHNILRDEFMDHVSDLIEQFKSSKALMPKNDEKHNDCQLEINDFGKIPIMLNGCPLKCDNDNYVFFATMADIFKHFYESCNKCHVYCKNKECNEMLFVGNVLNHELYQCKSNACHKCHCCNVDNLTLVQLNEHESTLQHQSNALSCINKMVDIGSYKTAEAKNEKDMNDENDASLDEPPKKRRKIMSHSDDLKENNEFRANIIGKQIANALQPHSFNTFLQKNENPLCVKFITFAELMENQKISIVLSNNNQYDANNKLWIRHCDSSMVELGAISNNKLESVAWHLWLCDSETKFEKFFNYLNDKIGINTNDYLFYLARERKNNTLRPTRQLFDTTVSRHRVATSLNDAIWKSAEKPNQQAKKIRSFDVYPKLILFKKDEIYYLNGDSSDTTGSNNVLILLKYFDVFIQRLTLVGALIVDKEQTLLSDILYLIETRLLTESSFMKKLNLKEMIKDRIFAPVWSLYEEECGMARNVKIYNFSDNLDKTIKDCDIVTGDIFIFSLNQDCTYLKQNQLFNIYMKQSEEYLKAKQIPKLPIPNQIMRFAQKQSMKSFR